jgi:hypothetical protein
MGQFTDAWDAKGSHTHVHTLNDFSEAETTTWINQRKVWLKANDILFVHRQSENKQIFSFENEVDHYRFVREGAGSSDHTHTQNFVCPVFLGHYASEFQSYCSEHGLDIQVTQEGMQLRFEFSDLPAQHHALALIHDGTFDELAKYRDFEQRSNAEAKQFFADFDKNGFSL